MTGSLFEKIIAFVRMRIAAARQTPSQVFQRKPGDRFLSGPLLAVDEARDEWQFALLSVAAYGRSNPKRRAIPAGKGLLRTAGHLIARNPGVYHPESVDNTLKGLGCELWNDFPDEKLKIKMQESHLRAEVWHNVRKNIIVAAFGGTVFTSGKDWLSNLRWFIPWHKDEYTDIVENFAPDFVEMFLQKSQKHSLENAVIYSTGHSLGGGLAQQFAYALPIGRLPKKVEKVYAFDPSPVTGFYSVFKAIRNHNKKNLNIIRSYERGEVLAVVRSITSVFLKPSAIDPEIRGVRFSLFYTLNPIAGHSMQELAETMQAVACRRPSPGAIDQRNVALHDPAK